MGGFYHVRVNLGKFPHYNHRDIVLFPVLALSFRAIPSTQFIALPPIKNYIFGSSGNRAVSSEKFGLIL